MSRARRILIVRMSALGDIVHALPAQQRLAREAAGAELHWLVERPYRPLLQCAPGIHRIWSADTRSWRKDWRRGREFFNLVRQLRSQRFDMAIDFQGLLKSAALARLSGADCVLGLARSQLREPAARHFYNLSLAGQAEERVHVILQNIQLAAAAGISTVPPSPLVDWELPAGDVDYVRRELDCRNIRQPVLINPGAGWVTKLWPIQNYARLAEWIHQRLGRPVVFTYGPGEEHLIEEARRLLPESVFRTFPTTILQLAALCREACLMVAGDTGPLHLAVSAGTPTVCIMGPSDPVRNGPFHPQDRVVRRQLPCSASYKRTCSQFICMDIPVSEVFSAVEERLRVT